MLNKEIASEDISVPQPTPAEEETSLLSSGDSTHTAQRARTARLVKLATRGLVVGVALGVAVGAVGKMSSTGGSASAEDASAAHGSEMLGDGAMDAASAVPPLSFAVYNEYTREAPLPSLLKWSLLAEPYRVTTLEANSESDPSAVLHAWQVTAPGGLRAEYAGASTSHIFTTPGYHSVSLTESANAPGVAELTTSADVMVKYVRRDIESINDKDRKLFFAAMHAVYSVPEDEGKLLYGEGFRDIHHFARAHLMGAAFKDCDAWHDGAAFYVAHAAVTRQFEIALQSVEPTVAMPYWEYSRTNTFLGNQWASAPLFQDDWFGNASSNEHPEHVIDTGAWAYTKIRQDAHGWSSVTNSYGLLRSPWNAFRAPYVTRYRKTNGKVVESSLPGCSIFQPCFRSNSSKAMNYCMAGATHGDVHLMIGGVWNHPDIEGVLADLNVSSMMYNQFFFMAKNIWRAGWSRVPDFCSMDTPEEDCQVWCPAELWNEQGLTGADVLIASGQMHWVAEFAGSVYYDNSSYIDPNFDMGGYHMTGYSDEDASRKFTELLKAMCSPGHVGEMFSSAAPYDPSFWPIHPTTERLLFYRRALAAAGVADGTGNHHFADEWGYEHSLMTATDTGTFCDWENMVPGKGGYLFPTCTTTGDAACPSHHAMAPLGGVHCTGICGFDEIIHDPETGGWRSFTNLEFYEFLHPDNDEVPYTYDSYEWPWCKVEGYPIEPWYA